MTQELNNNALEEVMTSILQRHRNTLLELTQEQLLNDRWHYRYNDSASAAWNLYQFSSCLESYKRDCRDWETHYNGQSCVVERVRDKYLMPRIKEFLEILKVKTTIV